MIKFATLLFVAVVVVVVGLFNQRHTTLLQQQLDRHESFCRHCIVVPCVCSPSFFVRGFGFLLFGSFMCV